MMELKYSYDVASLLVFFILGLYYMLMLRNRAKHGKSYMFLLVSAVICVVVDVEYYILKATPNTEEWLLKLSFWLSFLTLSLTMFFFFVYSTILVKPFHRENRAKCIFILTPIFCQMLLPFIIFYDDSSLYFVNRNGYIAGGYVMYISQIIPLLYIALSFLYTIIYRKALRRSKIIMSLVAIMMLLVFGMIRTFYPDIRLLSFMLSLYFLFMMKKLQTVYCFIDSDSQADNLLSLDEDLKVAVTMKRPFVILAFEIYNYNVLNKALGIKQTNLFLKEITDYFRKTDDVETIYRINTRVFGLNIQKQDTSALNDMLGKFYRRFEKPWESALSTSITARFCVIDCPDSVSDMNELYNVINHFMKNTKEERIVFADSFSVSIRERQHLIEEAISEGFFKGGFSILYRPIVDSLTGKPKLFSTTITLDSSYGSIGAEDIIRVADIMGQSIMLETGAFTSVCSFILKNHIWEYGIEGIKIPLSLYECTREDVSYTFIDIIDKYALPYNIFIFSITKFSDLLSLSYITENLKPLTLRGASIILENYGDGYTDASCLYEYPIDMISLSPNLLMDASKDERAMIALQCTVDVINELGIKLILQDIDNDIMDGISEVIKSDMKHGEYIFPYTNASTTMKLFNSQIGRKADDI